MLEPEGINFPAISKNGKYNYSNSSEEHAGYTIPEEAKRYLDLSISKKRELLSKIFRSYDVRGVYPSEINEAVAFEIGLNFGKIYKGKIGVGADTRLSSESLKEYLIKGLLYAGCKVINFGVITTPLLMFSTAFYGLDGSIQVSASHNPKEWNGFIFFRKNGEPIGYENGLNNLKKKILENDGHSSEIIFKENSSFYGDKNFGPINFEKEKLVDDYIKHIEKSLRVDAFHGGQNKIKVVVDAGNGAAGLFAPYVLRRFNVEVIELFCNPDGSFPNRTPDPTSDNLKALKEEVVKNSADLGLAFDADGDRLVVVTEKGEIIPPPQLFKILIQHYLGSNEKNKTERQHDPTEEKTEVNDKKIVLDTIAPSSLEEFITNYNGTPVGCRVGNVFIYKEMIHQNAILGGEISGHYFFKELYGADDAIFAGLKIIEYLISNGRPISQYVNKLPKDFYESIRISVPNFDKKNVLEQIKSKAALYSNPKKEVNIKDGLKLIFEEGWIAFRISNTESKLSVAYNASNQIAFEKLKESVNSVLKDVF